MEKIDGVKGELYVIDPKAIEKEKLYGDLDGTTLEWTDGIFTSLLRKILDNQKGESERRCVIYIFSRHCCHHFKLYVVFHQFQISQHSFLFL